MAILSQCCCGCSLKTGTISIAYFYLFSGLVQTGTTAYNLEIHKYDDGGGETGADTKLELIIGLVCGIIHAVCSLILLIGAKQENAGMLLPWIVVETLGTAAALVICVVVFIAAGSSGLFIVAIIFSLVLLNVYFLLVVHSYYRTLSERPRPDKLTDIKNAGV